MKSILRWCGVLGLLWILMPGAHAATTAKVTVQLVVTDAQGSVVATMTPAGVVTYSADYRPYGKTQDSPQPGPGYTGHVEDPTSGLVYMQQRYYDPAVGRFISPDPVRPAPGNLVSFNRYTYVSNNPIRYIDPDGRYECGDDHRSCAAAKRIVNGWTKARRHYKPGSDAYNKLTKKIKFFGTKNDGNGLNIVVIPLDRANVAATGHWNGMENYGILEISTGYLDAIRSDPARLREAELSATGAHETKHIMDDRDTHTNSLARDRSDEFWHEVRGERAETPVWEGLSVDDPSGTWTIGGGLDMNAVYRQAKASTKTYCEGNPHCQ